MAKISLYSYQTDAVTKMRDGCILCGGVGSGKSRTALAYFAKEMGADVVNTGSTIMDKERILDLYIITTARKRDTREWEEEMLPFLLSTHEDVSYYPTKVVVDSWNNIGKYADAKNSFFIFDEQRVIGRGAWVKSFLKIAKNNRWILLSATPGDTWQDYIPVFIANGYYRNRTEFNNQHVIYSRFSKYPKVDRYVGTGHLMKLRNEVLVDMDFTRSTKSHHEVIQVDYDIAKYKEASKTRWDPFKNQPMQQAADLCRVWRRIVNSDETRAYAVLEILDKHPKAIIFYNYDYELEILLNLGYISGTEIAQWNGHKHQEIPKTERWVYLVQYTAGCEGWNCIETDTTIFYSQNYSYKVMEQAFGRINRVNTPYSDLYYYHLKSKSGIDLAIAKAIKEKKEFNEGRFVKW